MFNLFLILTACPVGFEIISGIPDRCFYTKTMNSSGLTKTTSEYNCNVNGGVVAALETLDKYTAVINWLLSKLGFIIILVEIKIYNFVLRHKSNKIKIFLVKHSADSRQSNNAKLDMEFGHN